MKIYSYDRETLVFIGTAEADPDPMESGSFLIPAYATPKAAPETDALHRAFFIPSKDAWEVRNVSVVIKAVEEHRAVETAQQIILTLRREVQGVLDTISRAHGFDDMADAVTYADEAAIPLYQYQALALRAWRSRVWFTYENWERTIMRGGAAPTVAELLAELPVFGGVVFPEDDEAQGVEDAPETPVAPEEPQVEA